MTEDSQETNAYKKQLEFLDRQLKSALNDVVVAQEAEHKSAEELLECQRNNLALSKTNCQLVSDAEKSYNNRLNVRVSNLLKGFFKSEATP